MTKTRGDYKTRFKPQYGEKAMSRKAVAVALPLELDEFVRSLPNRAEWLREAIAEKYQREQQQVS